MSEFGHVYAQAQGCCIDSWGVGPFVIEVAGKRFRFEDSDRFGPYLINARGDVLDRQPGERSPFWRPHRIWVRQGRRVAADKVTCIWDEPAPTKVLRLTKRTCFVIENGDEDGETIVVDDDEARAKWMAEKASRP